MQTFSTQTTSLRFDYPDTWDPSLLTSVTLSIADVDGNELIGATAIDLYTPTTISIDSRRYSQTIALAEGPDDLAIGDVIRIIGIQGKENHVVKGYDSSTRIVNLESYVDRDFQAGADVYRLSGVATVDFTDIDPGTQIVLTWTPIGAGSPITELGEIEGFVQIDLAGFSEDLRAMFPRAYEALKSPADRLDRMIRICTEEITNALAIRGLDIARIIDQRRLTSVLSAAVAYHWSLGGDSDSADERETLGRYYSSTLESFCKLPIWQDSDGDGIQDDNETQSYPVIQVFERNW